MRVLTALKTTSENRDNIVQQWVQIVQKGAVVTFFRFFQISYIIQIQS